MAQGQRTSESTRQQQHSQGGGQEQQRNVTAFNLSAIAMRGFSQLYDMQAAAARLMLQTHARAATAFGLPDYSDLFRIADDRARRVFSSSTEQFLQTAEQANQTLQEVQKEMGRMVEFQTVNAAENFQQGLQELEAQAEENLTQLREFARQQAEQAMLATENLSETARESIREGGEQIRQSMEQGRQELQQHQRHQQEQQQQHQQEQQDQKEQQRQSQHQQGSGSRSSQHTAGSAEEKENNKNKRSSSSKGR